MTSEKQVTIEYMPLDELIRAPRNPKDHDLGTINQSIDRFGFINPLLINEKTGRLVAGHGRLDALQAMKVTNKKPPARVVVKGNRWFVPVIRGVAFETDEEAEAYLIADNRLVEIGGWDEKGLSQMLSDLAAMGDEMLNGVGFDTDDLDAMLARLSNNSTDDDEKNEKQEDIPEQWNILIECADEMDQSLLLEELSGRGLKVRALIA